MNEPNKQETAVTQLAPRRMQLAEHARQVWHITPEKDTPLDAVLEPKYWAHVSMQMKPGDHIEVLAEDGTWFAELIAIDPGRLYCKVALLRKAVLEKVDVEGGELAGLQIRHRGALKKWCVIRENDVIQAELGSKEAARAWALEHLKAMAA